MARANRRKSARRRNDGGIRQLPWSALRNPYRPLEVLSEEQLEAIHLTSLQILEELGIEFMSETALDPLARSGARVERASGVVRFDRGLIAELVAKAPAEVTLTPRDPARDRALEIFARGLRATAARPGRGRGAGCLRPAPQGGDRAPSRLIPARREGREGTLHVRKESGRRE